MRFLLFLIIAIVSVNQVFAKDYSKCTELSDFIHNRQATISNVLNLSQDQQKSKETIDNKFLAEIKSKQDLYEQEKYVLDNLKKYNASSSTIKKQEKLLKNIQNSIEKINNKYDNEFKTILDSEQKNKLNSIKRIEKKELRYCKNNKIFTKRDPKLRQFGEKM